MTRPRTTGVQRLHNRQAQSIGLHMKSVPRHVWRVPWLPWPWRFETRLATVSSRFHPFIDHLPTKAVVSFRKTAKRWPIGAAKQKLETRPAIGDFIPPRQFLNSFGILRAVLPRKRTRGGPNVLCDYLPSALFSNLKPDYATPPGQLHASRRRPCNPRGEASRRRGGGGSARWYDSCAIEKSARSATRTGVRRTRHRFVSPCPDLARRTCIAK